MNHPLGKKELKSPKTIETSQQSKASDLNQNTLSIVFPKEISSLYLTHASFGCLN